VSELRYSDEGDTAQLPVLFLHAFPYHRAIWEGQRAALHGQARFLSLDARGVGPKAPMPNAYLLEHLVDDALALLDALKIESALWCGCSMGGYVALRAVERAPERVRGLLLVDTQAGADTDQAKLARAAGLRTLAVDGKAAFARAQLERQLAARSKQSDTLMTTLTEMIEQSSSAGIAANLVAIATRTDVRAALPNIRVPTRVLVGGEDAITTPDVMRALADAIPGADYHVIEGAGHLPNVEAEAEFNRSLLEFIARVR
jgi:3-oxoadipate enol-lactonase